MESEAGLWQGCVGLDLTCAAQERIDGGFVDQVADLIVDPAEAASMFVYIEKQQLPSGWRRR